VVIGGAYIVARAYIFGALALRVFVRALKFVAVIVIALAALEHLTQSIVTNNLIAALWGTPGFEPDYRSGMLRAYSTFAHPIFYGTFCATAAAIFLYSQQNLSSRVLYGVGCFIGCLMAMSSAPLISFMIVMSAYSYDHVMRRVLSRWRVLQLGLIVFFVTVYLTTNKPVSWVVSHLTLDPSTGYFRVATWDTSLYYIGLSPLVGYGFEVYGEVGDFFANATVDSVWLVLALRFGVPLVALILLTNIASFYRSGKTPGGWRRLDPYMDGMRTAFTLVLVIFIFAGLTVHFWNNIWMLWGLFVGIRASLHEDYLRSSATQVLDRPVDMAPSRALGGVAS
jgi:hypothetical protein